jgi:hypothetical protein
LSHSANKAYLNHLHDLTLLHNLQKHALYPRKEQHSVPLPKLIDANHCIYKGVFLAVGGFRKKEELFFFSFHFLNSSVLDPIFSYGAGLFLKAEIANPPSNSTWSKIQCVSIERSENKVFQCCIASVLTTQRITKATGWRSPHK